MPLKMLKPRLASANLSRVQVLKGRAGAVERKRGSAGVKDRNKIRERDCGLCQTCKGQGRVTLGAVVDHRLPLWAGGSDEDENKWLLCISCHDTKTAQEAKERAAGL